MKLKSTSLAILALSVLATVSSQAAHIWINEFHYDNGTPSADENEFVEIAFRSGTTTAIGNYTLDLYNGSNGALYGSFDLATMATMGAVVPIANDPMNRTITLYTVLTPGLQNGAPDGFAISLTSDASFTPGTFLSYEGAFAATSGPATGVTSTDVGVAETGTSPTATSSIFNMGTGIEAADFTFAQSDTGATPGVINVGQTFAIPEPSAALLGALGSLILLRRRR